ncbi:MAG TPA: molecular chaperone TorD family protein [Coriobacteriia bacterium]
MDPLTMLASLFLYPDDEYARRAVTAAAALKHPALDTFVDRIRALGTTALQERFIDTFDLNPAATLEIGWHIYGEQYERGELLVTLRQHLRDANIAETGELPDHLIHVLPLLAAMNAADRAGFVDRYLDPALERIAAALPAENPFADLVRATREIAVQAQGLTPAAGGCHD